VAQVWFLDEDLSIEGVTAEYGPRITGEVPEEQWFVVVDGVEAAWFQAYGLAHFPEYADACAAVGFDPAGGAIDYLLGRAEDRGRGLGPTLIEAFSEHILARHPEWPGLCSSPAPDNVRSWRALEKAGFRFVGDIVTEEGPERLMARDRSSG
jgi:aminoglycoside 6'-N-acetyltransferase